jgi:hypothetical protein
MARSRAAAADGTGARRRATSATADGGGGTGRTTAAADAGAEKGVKNAMDGRLAERASKERRRLFACRLSAAVYICLRLLRCAHFLLHCMHVRCTLRFLFSVSASALCIASHFPFSVSPFCFPFVFFLVFFSFSSSFEAYQPNLPAIFSSVFLLQQSANTDMVYQPNQ